MCGCNERREAFNCGPAMPVPQFKVSTPDGMVLLLPSELRIVLDEGRDWLDGIGQGGSHGAN